MFYQNILLIILLSINVIITIPPNDKALFGGNGGEDDEDTPEGRRKHRRPCRGRSNNEEGRTFFDWSYQYIDVNYNYNYNIDCGGIGGNKPQRPQKPHFQGGHLGQHFQGGLLGQHLQNRPPHNGGGSGENGGIHQRPPIGGGLINGLFNGIFSQSQSQSQDGLFNGQILNSFTSLLPQNGFFNGQGVSSLFDGGLFNNLFNSNNNNIDNPVNRPIPPPQPTTTPTPLYSTTHITTTTEDPDDMIYNDERPVHEAHDPIVPDPYNNYRPGQYLIASNPLFGDYVHDLSNFDINPNKIIRQINRGVRKVIRPLTHLLKK